MRLAFMLAMSCMHKDMHQGAQEQDQEWQKLKHMLPMFNQ